jgi:hypothetical protein
VKVAACQDTVLKGLVGLATFEKWDSSLQRVLSLIDMVIRASAHT